jgi:aldehyde:ferredoxin oxidoreductase
MRQKRTGKRLYIDLGVQRSWVEEIPAHDLDSGAGGRYLNAKFFLEHISSSLSPSSPKASIALAVGPLAGTLAPCSGWTSISTFSFLSDPPGYAHASLPGHWGPHLKFAGFDQCIIQGKGKNPLYLWIDGEKVRFVDAKALWGKDILEATVAIQEETEDRDAEILCIGPAGERGVPFANVVNRFSWAADHVGLGHAFGTRNLKAIAIRGRQPVALDQPRAFLDLCLALKDRIYRDPNCSKLKEEGTFFSLGKNGGGLGVQNFNEASSPELEEKWKTAYFREFLYGREGCFSCPIHCGRITHMEDDYFGGVHLEGAWSLGPRIGVNDWKSTLKLYRLCQKQGLDPSAVGSLLSWLMDGFEKGVLSSRDLGQTEYYWGDVEAAFRVIDGIISGQEAGEIFRQGPLRAAKKFDKGLDLVAHVRGIDLPVRDPRSSMEHAVAVALFPAEWDFLRSMPLNRLSPSQSPSPGVSGDEGIAVQVSAAEDLKILADLTSLCPLVVSRIPIISISDIAELTATATGKACPPLELMQKVQETIQIEKTLSKSDKGAEDVLGVLPSRFFRDRSSALPPLSKDVFDREISRYRQKRESTSPGKMEKRK